MIKLTIGKRLDNHYIKDSYLLVVHFEHGDAVVNTEETFRYEPSKLDQLQTAVEVLHYMVDSSLVYLSRAEKSKIIQGKLPLIDANTIDELVREFTVGDVTNDYQTDAATVGYDLYYYDSDGHKYAVEVEVSNQ